MAARTAWTGAINFGGFPIPLAAYNMVASKSAESFKSLCPCHKQPIKQHKVCEVSGEVLATEDLLKGTDVTGRIWALDKAATDAIRSAESTKELEVERFAPLDSVPTWLATGQFRFTAAPKAPGAESSANVLWNGLHASKRAAIIDGWIPRAGSRPTTLAIYADDDGALVGITLPYRTALNEVPAGAFSEDEKAQAMFEAFVESQGYSTEPFDISEYVDLYKERRDELIAKAIKGEPLPTAPEPTAKPAGPDLMAAMEAAMGKAKPAKKKSSPAKKKAKATT